MSQAGTCDPKDMLLSARGVFKTFGLNAVLKGIDLDVGKGEVLALIGGNGAGKSTLMKIIMGIYQPDEGELVIAGDKISSWGVEQLQQSLPGRHRDLGGVGGNLAALAGLFIL